MTRRALFLMPSDRMGGAERILRTVAKEAARSGHFDHVDIFVLCLGRTGTLDDLEAMGNIALHYALSSSHLRGIWRLFRFLRNRRFDLVMSSATHLNAATSSMRRIGWLRTSRLVARESTMIFDREFGSADLAIKALYRLYGAQDLIICQTDRMRSSLDENTGGRLGKLLVTIPNPIDFDRIEDGLAEPVPAELDAIPRERTKIVWCGRFTRVKNPLRAVDTLKALHAFGRVDTHLVMIGDGPERAAARAHADAVGLADYVTFTGHRPNPSGIMARCSLGLLTSDTEGFPNVILEMLASGVERVATTNCAGGLAELPGVCVSHTDEPTHLASQLMNAYPVSTADILRFCQTRRSEVYSNSVVGTRM